MRAVVIARPGGPEVLELREVPEIRFLYDDSLDKGGRVEDLLRRLERGEPVEGGEDA